MDASALFNRTNRAALAAFGQSITLNGVVVRGDFCEPSDEVFLKGVSAVVTVPIAIVVSSDVPASPVGKTLIANAKSYTIADARPDAYGFTSLMLELA